MREGIPRSFVEHFNQVFELCENGHPRPEVAKIVLAGELRRANAIRHAGLVATPSDESRHVLMVWVPDEQEAIGVLNTREIATAADLGAHLEKMAAESEERLKFLRGDADSEQDSSAFGFSEEVTPTDDPR